MKILVLCELFFAGAQMHAGSGREIGLGSACADKGENLKMPGWGMQCLVQGIY